MDTLFENGAVLTLEDGARTAEALLVRDGRIVLAGTREEAGQLAGTGARQVDLQGHTLLPAFIDPHGHFSAAANALLQVPLDECVTRGNWPAGCGSTSAPSVRSRARGSSPRATTITR